MSTLILQGDARRIPLADQSVHCVITSPPFYGLRSYLDAAHKDKAKEIGLEQSLQLYLAELLTVFRDCWRILRDDGVMFVEMGDSYSHSTSGGGSIFANGRTDGRKSYETDKARGREKISTISSGFKPKNKMLIPHRFAIAMQEDGWICRQDNVWHHVACMPESVSDRSTTAHSYVFQFVKQGRYFYDAEAIREGCSPTSHGGPNVIPGIKNTILGQDNGHLGKWTAEQKASGRNARSVWAISSGSGFADAHFATFPPELVKRCLLAGTSEKGCCPRCKMPWVREVEKERTFQSGSGRSGILPIGKNGPALQGGGATLDVRRGPCVSSTTLGWRPGCSCNAGAQVPCTVFDPFGGSSTTALVADRLGRHGISLDLSLDYCIMGRDRIGKETPLFATIEPTPAAPYPQASLFS